MLQILSNCCYIWSNYLSLPRFSKYSSLSFRENLEGGGDGENGGALRGDRRNLPGGVGLLLRFLERDLGFTL